jgi:hypothetical protein
LHLSEHRLDGCPASHVYLYGEDADSSLPPAAAAEDCPWGMREARLTDLTATSCTSVLRSRSGTGSTSLIGGVPHPFQNEPVGTCTLACAVCQRPPLRSGIICRRLGIVPVHARLRQPPPADLPGVPRQRGFRRDQPA